MKKIGIFVFLIFATGSLFAQMEEGRKMLDYERFQSAANIFKQLANGNSNTEAVYWLGQTYLQNEDNLDTAAVKKLYQDALQANPNDPLLMVGIGEVELLEGKKDDARNRFETAMNNLKKKKDLTGVQIAIGRANIDVKDGDLNYAVEILNQALETKKLSDQEKLDIQMNLGNAYRKLIEGGKAVTHYQEALAINPNAARASFMMGRIYQTQGIAQEDIYMNYYFDAIREDPKFAPVYYWLYTYYYQRDVNEAKQYLDDYIANTDQDSKLCYAQASLEYVSQRYQETVDKAKSCIAQTADGKPFPSLYGLQAYAYNKMGDFQNSRDLFQEYFERVNPDLIGPTDYLTYGQVLMNFPGQEDLASENIDKGVALDTVYANKINDVYEIAQKLYGEKNYKEAGRYYSKLMSIDTTVNRGWLFWTGWSYLRANEPSQAEAALKIYRDKFPEDFQAWYLSARAQEMIDTARTEGLCLSAKPLWEKVIAVGDTTTDKTQIKQNLSSAYTYMLAYYYSVEDDVATANEYNEKILELNPDDENALSRKKVFENYLESVEKAKQQAKNGGQK